MILTALYFLDTSNLSLANLATSRKSKCDVGVEGLDALLSAPIVHNGSINASDAALVSI